MDGMKALLCCIGLFFAAAPPLQAQLSEAATAEITRKINGLIRELGLADTIVQPTEGSHAVSFVSTQGFAREAIAKRWHLLAALSVGNYFNENPSVSAVEISFFDPFTLAEPSRRYRVLPLSIAKTLSAKFMADEKGDVADAESMIWDNLKEKTVERALICPP